jgi:hypothetical protein
LLKREWRMRAAQLRADLQQNSDGLADQDRAIPLAVPQVMQPRPDLGRHDQGIAHADQPRPRILRLHDIAIMWTRAGHLWHRGPTAPRGPAGPATRRYLVAGLLACGRCGPRLESAWSNGKPAYRCRHGHTSAARPAPGRAKNTYVREDQILLHLAALAILHAGNGQAQGRRAGHRPRRGSRPVDRLRASGVILTYDQYTRTLRVGDRDNSVAVTVGRDR